MCVCVSSDVPDSRLSPDIPDSELSSDDPDSGLFPDVPDSGLSSADPDSGLFPDVPDSGLFPDVPDLGLSPDDIGEICAAAAGGGFLMARAAGIFGYKMFKKTSKYYIQLIVENINKIFNVQNKL